MTESTGIPFNEMVSFTIITMVDAASSEYLLSTDVDINFGQLCGLVHKSSCENQARNEKKCPRRSKTRARKGRGRGPGLPTIKTLKKSTNCGKTKTNSK